MVHRRGVLIIQCTHIHTNTVAWWHRKHILSAGRKFRQCLKSDTEHNKSLHPVVVGVGTSVHSLACGVCTVGSPAKSKPPRLLLSPQGHFLLSSVWCMRAGHYWALGPNTGSCLSCCRTPFCQVTAGLWVSQEQREFDLNRGEQVLKLFFTWRFLKDL